MLQRDKRWVWEYVKDCQEMALKRRESIDDAFVSADLYADEDRVIGVCGRCGGDVVSGRKATAPMFLFRGAHCARCNARPAPMQMIERRSETKPVTTPERRR